MNIKNADRSRLTFIEKFEEHIKIIESKTNLKRKEIIIGISTCLFLIWIRLFDIYISYLTDFNLSYSMEY